MVKAKILVLGVGMRWGLGGVETVISESCSVQVVEHCFDWINCPRLNVSKPKTTNFSGQSMMIDDFELVVQCRSI